MTPNQRALAAFRFEPVDRIPFYEQVISSSVATEILGHEAHTGGSETTFAAIQARIKGEQAYAEFQEQAFEDYVALHKALEFDMARAQAFGAALPDEQLDEYTFLFGNRKKGDYRISRYDPVSQVFTTLEASPITPERMRRDLAEREKRLTDQPLTEADFEPLKQISEALPDRLLLAQGCTFAIPMNDVWLEWVMTEPGLVQAHLDVATERALQSIRVCRRMGADVGWGGGDLAYKKGPIYSPGIFRKMMLPRFKKVVDVCHELGMFYLFRTDGWIWPFGDMLFEEIGCDAYGEIDAAAGMDLGELRARYPRLVFWGNVPCGTVLHGGTVEEVKAAARDCIEDTGARGLVLGSSNTVMHGTPPENVFAMLEVAKEGGRP